MDRCPQKSQGTATTGILNTCTDGEPLQRSLRGISPVPVGPSAPAPAPAPERLCKPTEVQQHCGPADCPACWPGECPVTISVSGGHTPRETLASLLQWGWGSPGHHLLCPFLFHPALLPTSAVCNGNPQLSWCGLAPGFQKQSLEQSLTSSRDTVLPPGASARNCVQTATE